MTKKNDDGLVFWDHRQAWRDFFDVVRPGIWGGLSRDERRTINTAERDFWGKRGKSLGVDRVVGLLERFAPGRYVVERRVVFRVVDVGELSPPDNPG